MITIPILPFGVVAPSTNTWERFSGRIYQMWLADEIGKGQSFLTQSYLGYDPQKLLPAPERTEPMDEEIHIVGAKLTFTPIRKPPPSRHLGFRMGANSFRAYADTAVGDIHYANSLMRMRTYFIVGYDPQRLLPAPSFEREMMQSISEWAAEQIKLPYTEFAQSVFNTLTRDGEVIFKPVRHPLDDIDAFRDYVMNDTGRLEPLVVTDTMHDAIQKALQQAGIETNIQMVTYMHATFIHESDLGDRTPRGRIELFDYDDLPPIIDESFWLKPRQQGKTDQLLRPKLPPREHASPKRDQGYLDHDPTKRHRRRKKR